MDRVILELVEIDRQARDAVRAAQEKSAAEQEKIAREKETLAVHYRKRAQQKAEIMETRTREASQRELAALEERCRASLLELETDFHQREQQWADEIVRRCLRP